MTSRTFTVAKVGCDRAACPAPAVRHYDLHGQDFHFCNHHADELEAALGAEATGLPVEGDRDDGGLVAAPAGQAG